jgi:5-hydroxyisourate hydrolase-like protein (transthyretin family)
MLACLLLGACSLRGRTDAAKDGEAEPLSRTEFTGRIENFFEYEPLRAGQASRFLIHLTDLSDGAPVEQAEVVLSVRPRGGDAEVAQSKARVGKVTGIYVAEVTVAKAGEYDIEFRVRNARLDERMPLKDFKAE